MKKQTSMDVWKKERAAASFPENDKSKCFQEHKGNEIHRKVVETR